MVITNESGFKFGDMLPLIRIGLSGEAKGPDLFDIMEILGRDIVVERMTESIRIFDQVVKGVWFTKELNIGNLTFIKEKEHA